MTQIGNVRTEDSVGAGHEPNVNHGTHVEARSF